MIIDSVMNEFMNGYPVASEREPDGWAIAKNARIIVGTFLPLWLFGMNEKH